MCISSNIREKPEDVDHNGSKVYVFFFPYCYLSGPKVVGGTTFYVGSPEWQDSSLKISDLISGGTDMAIKCDVEAI